MMLLFNYDLGQQLKDLRGEGILIIGSGNIVHNLRTIVWEDKAFDWAIDFDAKVKQWILDKNHEPLIHYEQQGSNAALSTNSAEHYLPFIYTLGAADKNESIHFFNEHIWGGSLSMRCVQFG